MNILLCGASGFIGQAIHRRLKESGHKVIRAVRHPCQPNDVPINYASDTNPAVWLPRLQGIDAVVNAVGILLDGPSGRFTEVHHTAPAALFSACVKAGVKRVIQISALGAATESTPYFRSKFSADKALSQLPLEWLVLRPSLVYGDAGASARFFRLLASLPVLGVPSLGEARFQPIHLDDLCESVLRALDPSTPARQCIDLVGSKAVSFGEMLMIYRQAMGFGQALSLPLPRWWMALCAVAGGVLLGLLNLVWPQRKFAALLTPDTWRMLQAGNAADTAGVTQLLGRMPRSIHHFISPQDALSLRLQALAAWRGPLLRVALAFVWLSSAWVSVFVFPHAESMALLSRVGLNGAAAWMALYSAAGLNAALGIATLCYPRRVLWAAQIVLIVIYSTIIAAALPEFISHPFGPILKNVPILAILLLLLAETTSTSTPSSSIREN